MTMLQFSPRVNVVHPLAYAPDFQPTSTSKLLRRWWRQETQGVCCLVGLGGCGKTAAVDHFLRSLEVLPGVTSANQSRTDLEFPSLRPQAVIVFSLAEGNPDALFNELYFWIRGEEPPPSSAPYDVVRRALAAFGQYSTTRSILLVIDGIEAAQSPGGADGAGRLLDQRIRDLMTRVAYGALPGVCMLTTTRLAPIDIEIQRLPHYTKIEVEAMDPESVIALLRARGILESDRELLRIGEAYAYHALTLDLVSSYMRHLGTLPPSLPVATSATPQVQAGASATDLDRTQISFERVVSAYMSAVLEGRESKTAHALLQLLSIFRRGASESLLDDLLGTLNNQDGLESIEGSLVRLSEMRMVRCVESREGVKNYSLHEMIRDFVRQQIPELQRKAWHVHVAGVLAQQVEAQSSAGRLGLEVLDLFEEIVHHQARGPNPMEGFLTYWQQIGNYSFLAHHLCDYARGERLCRILNLDHQPSDVAGYLRDDGRGADTALLADWGLYLLALGELSKANRVFMVSHACALSGESHTNLPISARNLADAYFSGGELDKALFWAERGRSYAARLLEHFEFIPTQEVVRGFQENIQVEAMALAFRGDVDLAEMKFDEIRSLHRDASAAHRSLAQVLPFYAPIPSGEIQIESFAHGRPWCTYLLLRGDLERARSVAEQQLNSLLREGDDQHISIELREIIARALLGLRDNDLAVSQVDAIEHWASTKDSALHLCEAMSLRASIALIGNDGESAYAAATEGLRIARESGFGIKHIDLLILLAHASILLGDPDEALHAVSTALFGQIPLEKGIPLYQAPARNEFSREAETSESFDPSAGIFPPAETGRPFLLAATHPSCNYRWGEAAARRIRGEALLYRLAVESRNSATGVEELTESGWSLIAEARKELESALHILESLVFAERLSTDARIHELRLKLQDLDQGILTPYEIYDYSMVPLDTSGDVGAGEQVTRRPRIRVLISYSHRDADFACRLADDLEQVFEDVWIDRRRIHVGESFVSAINRALVHVTDLVLVFSRFASLSPWVENELNAAIARRNQGKFLRIRPIIIDDAELPPLVADLDVLKVQDDNYQELIGQLVTSIRLDRDLTTGAIAQDL